MSKMSLLQGAHSVVGMRQVPIVGADRGGEGER